jgi:uncharacterized membrane protein
MESHVRTIAKTVSWRVLGTVITSGVVYLITGKAELGLSIAALDCFVKLITYYAHERAWNSISFGYHDSSLVPKTVDFNPQPAQLQHSTEGC